MTPGPVKERGSRYVEQHQVAQREPPFRQRAQRRLASWAPMSRLRTTLAAGAPRARRAHLRELASDDDVDVDASASASACTLRAGQVADLRSHARSGLRQRNRERG
eukprot:5679288-Ditylum_brightwellii.AAC.1